MIRITCFIVLISLFACNSENNDTDQSNIELEAQIINAEIIAYPLTSSNTVNSVNAKIFNHGNDGDYQYIVTLFQGEDSWSDTIKFHVLSGDTVHPQFIFSESHVDEYNPASFSGTLEKINTNK